jgi:FkbM family methyltransferase
LAALLILLYLLKIKMKINKIIIKLKGLFSVNFKNLFKKFKKFNAYNDLDKKLLKYINYKDGFYIDCGANDGINQSTTWFYEKTLNWRGILIEPIPQVFEMLKKNRSKDNIFVNAALVSKRFAKKYIDINFNPLDTLTGSVLYNNKNSKKNLVKAVTLSSIFKNNKIKKVDFFSLDVEGYEFEVLQGINFKKFKFKYILVETANPKKLNNFFLKKNYNFIERLSDYKFKKIPEYGDYLYKNCSF